MPKSYLRALLNCIILCMLLLSMSSCTSGKYSYSHQEFKKRKYTNGQYVEGLKKRAKKPSLLDTSVPTAQAPFVFEVPEESENKSIPTKQNERKDRIIASLQAVELDPVGMTYIKKQHTLYERYLENSSWKAMRPPIPAEELAPHWGSIAGFACAVSTVLFLATGILAGFGFLTLLCGVIFSAIGLSNSNDHPEKYSGKGLAIAGLAISLTLLALLALLIALLLNAGGWSFD